MVLLILPPRRSEGERDYLADLRAATAEFLRCESECVATREPVPGLAAPAVIIADRWGQIAHVSMAASVARLPRRSEVISWLEFIQNRCPECEGESR